MALRRLKPTSAGVRGMTMPTFDEITTNEPHKPLTEKLVRGSGRNFQGKITVRHRGGEQKRLYRKIDFRRNKFGVPARVATVEYDPNRSARIGLLNYADGEKRYMLLPNGLSVGTTWSRAQMPKRRSETPCRSAACHSVPPSTTSSSFPGRVGRWSAPPEPLRSSLRKRVHLRPSACLLARCVSSHFSAWQPWARSRTLTTRTWRSVRPGAHDTWASVQKSAALQ